MQKHKGRCVGTTTPRPATRSALQRYSAFEKSVATVCRPEPTNAHFIPPWTKSPGPRSAC